MAIVWSHDANELSKAFKEQMPEINLLPHAHQLIDQLAIGFALCDGARSGTTVEARHYLEAASCRDYFTRPGAELPTSPVRMVRACKAIDASCIRNDITRAIVANLTA